MAALRAAHVGDFLGPNDGQAAARVAALIDRLAKAAMPHGEGEGA
jgi:hypothetical protein